MFPIYQMKELSCGWNVSPMCLLLAEAGEATPLWAESRVWGNNHYNSIILGKRQLLHQEMKNWQLGPSLWVRSSLWALVLLGRGSEKSRSAAACSWTRERNWTLPYATRSAAEQPRSKGGSRLITAVPWLGLPVDYRKTKHTWRSTQLITPRILWWLHQGTGDSTSFSLLYHPQHLLPASRPPHVPKWLLSTLSSYTQLQVSGKVKRKHLLVVSAPARSLPRIPPLLH